MKAKALRGKCLNSSIRETLLKGSSVRDKPPRKAWMSHALHLLILSALLFLGLARIAAAESLALRNGAGEYELGPHLYYLEDPDGKLRIGDVLDGRTAQAFVQSPMARPGFGFTNSAYWFRVEASNVDASVQDWLLEVQYPLLDEIDVHLVYPGQARCVAQGRRYPAVRATGTATPASDVHRSASTK